MEPSGHMADDVLDTGRKRRSGYLALVSATLLLTSASAAQQPSPQGQFGSGPTIPAPIFTIPDGTPVPLRFAQPVRGKVVCQWKAPCTAMAVPQAKASDTVRLVAGTDIRVGQNIVIAKGSLGQATVTKVWRPLMALTGLALRFDWIEDITGKRIPLRIDKKGKQQPFTIQVLSTTGGMVARKETLRGDLAGKDTFDFSLVWHKKNWVPAGTRILAFTHGDNTRDIAEVTDAQALLPISNDTATLTVYRTKGDHDTHLHVSCDGNDFGVIDAEQYVVRELTPGKHECQVERQRPMDITANVGEDYFVRVVASTPGAWDLKLMDAGEGEDTIAGLNLVGKPSTETEP